MFLLRLLCLCFFFFQAEDGIRDVAVTGVQTCALPIFANGRSFSGFLSSPEAKPTLFHASIENNEPTIAAPIIGRTPSDRPPPAQKFAPKLAARAAALRPIVMPSRIRPARAAVFIAVNVVWMNAAVLTPRTLIQVSSTIDTIANMRWGETPKAMSPMGCGRCSVVPRPGRTSGDNAGQRTDVKRANATATAAIVPV